MSYIGSTPTTQAFSPAVDIFSGNGSATVLSLSKPVLSAAQVQVVVNNVPQNPASAYSVGSQTITFTSAPSSGTNNIYVYYTSPITQVIAPSQGTVSAASLTSTFLLPVANLSASGSPSSSNFLRGDGAWSTLSRSNMPAGTILQVVNAFKNDVFSSTSSTYTDVTGLSVSITPTSATNKIFILVTSSYTNSSSGQPLSINLVRGSTTISQPATSPAYFATAIPYVNQADIQVPWSLSYVDSPATTSATTYKIQAKSGGTWYINGGRSTNDFAQTSTIIVMEIAA
jgi:hypothetical protein